MVIQKRKNKAGRTTGYVVLVVEPNPDGGRGKRHLVGTFRLKTDAETAEREAKDQISRGTFNPDPPAPKAVPTVAEAVAVWLDTKRNSVEPNTLSGYQVAARLHLLPALGSILIPELTHDDVQRQVNAWRDAGTGARTIHRCVMILRATLQREVKARAVPYNVADGIEKPGVKKRRELTIWTPQQMRDFLEVAENDTLFPFWHLTLLEGMRRSEALGLRWRDLRWSEDETTCTATIQQTVIPDSANGGKALVQSRTKTRAGGRTIVLSEQTVAALTLHRDRQRFRRSALVDVWPDHDLIVTTEIGGVVNPSTVKRKRVRLMERAGVPAISTHDLRHIAATIMLQGGTPGAVVSQKIGHSSYATTVDIYGHVMPSEQAQANAAIDAYLARGN
jgi:integrase